MKPTTDPAYAERAMAMATQHSARKAAADDRRQSVKAAARELADSGLHQNWRAIETALVAQGYPDAPQALADEVVRGQLNVRCGGRRQPYKRH